MNDDIGEARDFPAITAETRQMITERETPLDWLLSRLSPWKEGSWLNAVR